MTLSVLRVWIQAHKGHARYVESLQFLQPFSFHSINFTSLIKLIVGVNTTLSHHYPTASLVTFENQVFAGLKTGMQSVDIQLLIFQVPPTKHGDYRGMPPCLLYVLLNLDFLTC